MIGRRLEAGALGVWLAAIGFAGAAVADATAASADVSVGIEVAPELTVTEPEEVTVASEPPDPVYEERIDMPGPGYVWVGGSWGWTGADWGWYPGRWVMAPAGRVYIEPYYERVGANVVYVRGYWGRPDAPRRYYGGERIRFAPVARPVDYRRGEPHFVRRAGVPIGARPAGFYEHGAGPMRPLPHAEVPPREPPREMPAAHPERGGDPRREVAGHDRAAPERAAPHPGPAPHYAPGPAPHYAPGPAPHYAPAPHARPGPPRK